MNDLRELRRDAGLTQHEFATLLGVALESLRTWDSGRRRVPPRVLEHAKRAIADRRRRMELVSIDQLGRELGVHERTLRAAARTGRLAVQFSSRSVFGRPIRRVTRAAGEAFMRTYYRRFEGHGPATGPLKAVPRDWDRGLRLLRREQRLSQTDLARRIGAAGKAVVYQWESRKRRPSPVLWQRVLQLEGRAPAR
jgi:DNA-binding transcriptional regulator YiaG